MTAAFIQDVVAASFQLKGREELLQRTRVRRIVEPRMVAIHLCRQHADHRSSAQVATAFLPAITDHGSVLNAQTTILKLMSVHEPLRLKVHLIEQDILDVGNSYTRSAGSLLRIELDGLESRKAEIEKRITEVKAILELMPA